MSPVTFRRICGLTVVDRPTLSPGSLCRSKSDNSTNDEMSPPSACRRAFSCLDCTERKYWSSSCHLISSRPTILERDDKAPPTDLLCSRHKKTRQRHRRSNTYLGAICRNPAEFTAFNLFLSDTNAELWGSSMSSPYRHLNRCGYRSGSKSWRRRSEVD